MKVVEPGVSADGLDPAVGGARVEPSPVVAAQDRVAVQSILDEGQA
jgi:hypothetical protein